MMGNEYHNIIGIFAKKCKWRGSVFLKAGVVNQAGQEVLDP